MSKQCVNIKYIFFHFNSWVCFTTADWTFIGIVGTLGILLLLAIFIIVILAATRNKTLNSKSRKKRPLPSTTGKKRRSDDVTYYSIRNPNNRFSQQDVGGYLEMSAQKSKGGRNSKHITDISTPVHMGDSVADDAYLQPISVTQSENEKTRILSGEYEEPMSPGSGKYDQMTEPSLKDYQGSENDLLNNYIILDEDEDPAKEKEALCLVKVTEVDEEAEEEAKVEQITLTVQEESIEFHEEEEEEEEEAKGENETPEEAAFTQNGLDVPSIGYNKTDFGSTVEL